MKFHPIRWLEKNHRIACSLVVLYMVFIFILSSIPKPPQPVGRGNPYIPIIEHLVEYGILGFLLLGAFLGNGKFRKYAPIFAVVIAVFYGITDEIHQSFVPYRDSDAFDVFVDSVGAVIGVVTGRIKEL